MRILIVEDSDSICRMIQALVSARGYAVTAVGTGAKAIEMAFANVPDVILLDLNLSGSFDGIGVCERVRKNPPTQAVPIIIISAMADEDSKRRALAAGATAYYTKPFSPISLLKEIDALKARAVSQPALKVQ